MALGQPSGWFIYRPPFNGFDDLRKVVDWLKGLKGTPYICVFPGSPEHWYWSLRYSLEGEPGYVLWGDKATEGKGSLDDVFGFPFKNLVQAYEEGHLKIEKSVIKGLKEDLGQVKPAIGLFYAADISQYLGFGLVTDVTLDAYRNFRGWSEDKGAWLLRWRTRVLWLDSVVEDLLRRTSNYKDFENGLKDRLKKDNLKLAEDLSNLRFKRENLCFKKEEISEEAWGKLRQIISDSREVERIVKLYSEVVQSPPIVRVPGPAVKREGCTPRALDASSYNKAMDEVRKELYLDDGTAKRFVAAASLGNVLLVGPPGVGKTSLAIRFAKALTGCDPMVKVANALWFRRDVIGGETLENGNVGWRSGFIIEAYNRTAEALERLGNRDFLVFLVIDELNRADVDKAFGDFFAMFLSPYPEEWHVPEELVDEVRAYSHRDKEAEDFLNHYGKHGDEPLRHIRIVATMNLADVRNLFMVGEALTRRFTVIEVLCPGGDKDLDKLLSDGLEELGKALPGLKDRIKSLVSCVRGKVNDKGLCIPPSAVKAALKLLSKDYSMNPGGVSSDSVLKDFAGYLQLSMGLVIGEERKNTLRNTVNECLGQGRQQI
ncbi:AAA family ATPase [Acidilobus sp. 7A]|uniref:AAA family ATPase n=1 Tax=Acidilobus sp. 7A TaxID=1577685 RepID=UPI000764D1DB|nr:AAA family ATPase [Acidilobus sp. 7A]AMD30726.1 hypothetical protein SE86_04750 [Acidilobus sp. 7A]